MPQLQHFHVKTSPDILLQAIRSDGAIIIDSVMSREEVTVLRHELDPYMEASHNGSDEFTGVLTTRTGGLVMRSPTCRELIQNELVLGLCNGFLLPNCQRYQLHLTQVIRLRPGQGVQPIHRDRWAWGTHLSHVEPQLNTIWAVTDFTLENGATRVVPGSSDWPDDKVADDDEITQAEMQAGSVLIYSGSVFHGGGENRSDADRIGLNITYSLGWLRQEENQYLSTPPDLARELTKPLQELIGYSMGQYALGYYSPPGAAGDAPDIVPPQYALGHLDVAGDFGSPEELEYILTETGGQAP